MQLKCLPWVLPPSTLITVFNNTNFIESNGNLSDFRRLYLSLTETRVNDIEALENVIVRSDSNRIIKLKDIAAIELQQQQEFVIVNANGNDAVLIDLVKQQGINLLDFSKNVQAKADEIRKILPPGVELKTYYDQSAFVGDSIHSVVKTIYEGLLLAILVMIVFLRSWRASLVVLLTIPVTIATSLLFLYSSGLTINVMSLGGIAAAIGLIIDDAIVIIEQIYRTHEEHPEKDNYSIVKQAIKDLFPAMVGSSLSTIVIFIPFRMMSGLAGSFFKELSDTMQIVLVCSFLVTWFVLPVLHLAIGFKHSSKTQHPHSVNTHQLKWLTNLFHRPVYAIVFVLVLAGGAWLVSGKLETGFLPDLDEGTIVMDYYSP
ncbi:MAG: efflux RND transporter permease subunit, partial [Acinetobacter sp.]|nr:efflux RND transporter permease subunit [Acinetobacter sp.]